MRAFQIQDVKSFMSHLLLSHTFDRFLVPEASITTFNTFLIDGHIQKDYYSFDEADKEERDAQIYSRWEQLRPFCLSLIKGKKTPLGMKIVFQLSPENLEKILRSNHLSLSANDINGLFLNLKYDGKQLLATTGTSLGIFTMDKTLEQIWDGLVASFLKKHQIPFT